MDQAEACAGVVREAHADGLTAARDVQPRLGATVEKPFLEIVPGSYRVAVHSHNAIAAMQRRQGFRPRWQYSGEDRIDLRRRPDRHAGSGERHGIDDERQHDIHRHTGEDDRHPGPQGLLIERTRRVDRHGCLAALQLADHPLFF